MLAHLVERVLHLNEPTLQRHVGEERAVFAVEAALAIAEPAERRKVAEQSRPSANAAPGRQIAPTAGHRRHPQHRLTVGEPLAIAADILDDTVAQDRSLHRFRARQRSLRVPGRIRSSCASHLKQRPRARSNARCSWGWRQDCVRSAHRRRACPRPRDPGRSSSAVGGRIITDDQSRSSMVCDSTDRIASSR